MEPEADVPIEPEADVPMEPGADVLVEPGADVPVEPEADVLVEPAAEAAPQPLEEPAEMRELMQPEESHHASGAWMLVVRLGSCQLRGFRTNRLSTSKRKR